MNQSKNNVFYKDFSGHFQLRDSMPLESYDAIKGQDTSTYTLNMFTDRTGNTLFKAQHRKDASYLI